MLSKDKIRKKYFKLRKKNYYEVSEQYFIPLSKLLKNLFNKNVNFSFYYPANYEVNTLELLRSINKKKNFISLLPVISKKNDMKFYKWNYLETLKVNKYGMLEPFTVKNQIIPDVILVPLIAFDSNNHRLGYGKGYYDKFLNKYLKQNKNILTIGVAFLFQKYDKLPASKYDVKLKYILTENGLQ
tara:strand:+ start:272 stop:826 length:555 start_codon:yes stop_codon:yes gene_type:complete